MALKHPGINAVSLRDDRRIVATAGWDNRVRLYSWPKFIPLAILDVHAKPVSVLAWSEPIAAKANARILAAGSKDSRISLWTLYNDND